MLFKGAWESSYFENFLKFQICVRVCVSFSKTKNHKILKWDFFKIGFFFSTACRDISGLFLGTLLDDCFFYQTFSAYLTYTIVSNWSKFAARGVGIITGQWWISLAKIFRLVPVINITGPNYDFFKNFFISWYSIKTSSTNPTHYLISKIYSRKAWKRYLQHFGFVQK